MGKRLGVSQAAFYRHFPDKAALLEGIAEQVWRLTFESFLDKVDTEAFDPESAPTPTTSEPTEDTPASPLLIYMRTYAHCLASMLRSHPGAVMLLLTHPMSTPEQLSLLARVFVTLARRGFTPNADMLGLVNAVSIYTTAFVAAEVVPPVGGSPEQPADLSAASAALDPENAQAPRSIPRTRRRRARSSRTSWTAATTSTLSSNEAWRRSCAAGTEANQPVPRPHARCACRRRARKAPHAPLGSPRSGRAHRRGYGRRVR